MWGRSSGITCLPSCSRLSAVLPGFLHAEPNSKEAWRNLFLASAVFTSFNLLLLLTFKDVPSGASKTESVWQVLKRTVTNILEPRLLSWMAIMSGFWLMMYQLWDLQPNFIADWVDSRPLAGSARSGCPGRFIGALVEQTARGPMIPQQVLLSANAFFIILGVIGVAWLTRKMRTLEAMLIGMVMATVGVLVAGWTTSAYILVLGNPLLFARRNDDRPQEKRIPRPDRAAGKKGALPRLREHPGGRRRLRSGPRSPAMSMAITAKKRCWRLKYLAEKTPFGAGQRTGMATSPLWRPSLGVKRTEAMVKLQEVTGLDPAAATRMLWDTYHPNVKVWIPFAVVGSFPRSRCGFSGAWPSAGAI